MRGLRKRPEGTESSAEAAAPGTPTPFASRAGLRLVSAEPGRATATLRVQREDPAEPGVVSSDAISALVQATAAAAVGARAAVLGDVYITFVRPEPQHPLTAEAQVVKPGDLLKSCDVEVRDWNGDLVAKALLSYRL
jgi:acyl-coenzyme A thioesterase PaaI-like protein